MRQGRLRFPSGFSIVCSYEFDSSRGGRLVVHEALYRHLPYEAELTLVAADGEEHVIRVSQEAGPRRARFELVDETRG